VKNTPLAENKERTGGPCGCPLAIFTCFVA